MRISTFYTCMKICTYQMNETTVDLSPMNISFFVTILLTLQVDQNYHFADSYSQPSECDLKYIKMNYDLSLLSALIMPLLQVLG